MQEDNSPVNFYEPEDPYGEFSNIYLSPFRENHYLYHSN